MDAVSKMIYSLIEAIIAPIPGGLGRRLRYWYFKRRLKHLGEGTVFDVGVQILNPEYVSIGSHTWIDQYVVVLAGPPRARGGPLQKVDNPYFQHDWGEVVIGDHCHIALFVVLQGHGGLSVGSNSTVASGSKLYSLTHHFSNPFDENDHTLYKFSSMAPGGEQSLIASPVVMQDNTALGLNSIMLPGGVISEGSWVGAASLVNHVIPPYSIAWGTPARVVKKRPGFEQQDSQAQLATKKP